MRYEITETVQQVITGYLGGANRDILTAGSASIAVKDLTGTNLTVYDGETGTGTLSNPLTADSSTGRIEGWVEAPDYDLVVSGAAITTYTQKIRLTAFGTVNVKSYGAKGDGTTNDTVAIQAAIDDLPTRGGTLIFPYGAYNFSSELNFDDTYSVILQGVGGMSGGTTPASALRFTGTGSGRAISARSSFGFTIRDLAVVYTSSFTGTLIDYSYSAVGGDTQHALIENSLIGSGTPTIQTAGRLLDLDKVISSRFSNVMFSGADVGVRGTATAGSYSNRIGFYGCSFLFMKTICAKNAARAWKFDCCTFEQLYPAGSSGGAGAYTSDASHLAKGLVFDSCGFDDANTTGTWINFVGSGLTVRGGYMVNGAKGISIPTGAGSRAISVTGVYFDATTTAFDVGSAVNYIDFWANDFNGVTNEIVLGATKPLGSRITGAVYSGATFTAMLDMSDQGNLIVLAEATEPGVAPANKGWLFLKDSGAGKTQLCARFASGVTQVIATEP